MTTGGSARPAAGSSSGGELLQPKATATTTAARSARERVTLAILPLDGWTRERPTGRLPSRVVKVTHIGTATVLLEVADLRLITDPALDPPGGAYRFALGLGSVKTEGPALPPGGLEPLDLA